MAVFTLRQYFREQRRTLPQPRVVDGVSSKTFMVTGSNVGLGFEASVHLAKMRPKLLLATSRNLAKCEQTRQSILGRAAASGVPSTEVYAWPLELGSFQNVRSFVDKFATDGNGTLNGLVANAGVLPGDYAQTQDGWEVALQVNYLSTALLSILLLPYLINSSSPDSPSRLVIVSSFAHYHTPKLKATESWSNILETINHQNFGNGVVRYEVSKLLEIIFIRELASRLPDTTPVVACTVNPGYCVSKITRNVAEKWIMAMFRTLFFVRSAEEGSRTLVHAAVSSDRSMHGRYLSSCQVTEESDFLFTPEGKAFSARLWDETITLLSGIDSRVSEIVENFLRVDSL
ncbi:short-chain dehydrogenase [Butyriboletus roseoflavus]|nr:short-chain dehydrogenase [Butyriboletus roseoflavus]